MDERIPENVLKAMCVDSFTSLDDLKGQRRNDDDLVLRTIMKNGGRFSVFDASDDRMAHTLTRICRSDLVKVDHSEGYPWTKLILTENGLASVSAADGGAEK